MKKALLLTLSALTALCGFAQTESTWTVNINCTEPNEIKGTTQVEMTNTGAKYGEFDIYSATFTLTDAKSNKAAKYTLSIDNVTDGTTTTIKYNNGGAVYVQPNTGDQTVTVSAFRNTKGIQTIWSLTTYGISDTDRRALAYFLGNTTAETAPAYLNLYSESIQFKGIQNFKDQTVNYITGSNADMFTFKAPAPHPIGVYVATIDYKTMSFNIEATESINVKIDGFTTFVAPANVTIPEGVSAYTLKLSEDDNTVLEAVKIDGESIAANTPVVVKSDVAGTYTFAMTSTPVYTTDVEGTKYNFIHDATSESNVLVGAMQPHNIAIGDYYYDGDKFTLWNEAKACDNKGKIVRWKQVYTFNAFAKPTFAEDVEKPETLTVEFPTDETTGIENIYVENRRSDEQAYNLFGQPVGDSYKGIVVVKGRKFIRK